MARKGNCYDNAFIKSVWSSLKYELVYHRFATLAEARSAIFHIRLHSRTDKMGDKMGSSQVLTLSLMSAVVKPI